MSLVLPRLDDGTFLVVGGALTTGQCCCPEPGGYYGSGGYDGGDEEAPLNTWGGAGYYCLKTYEIPGGDNCDWRAVCEWWTCEYFANESEYNSHLPYDFGEVIVLDPGDPCDNQQRVDSVGPFATSEACATECACS